MLAYGTCAPEAMHMPACMVCEPAGWCMRSWTHVCVHVHVRVCVYLCVLACGTCLNIGSTGATSPLANNPFRSVSVLKSHRLLSSPRQSLSNRPASCIHVSKQDTQASMIAMSCTHIECCLLYSNVHSTRLLPCRLSKRGAQYKACNAAKQIEQAMQGHHQAPCCPPA